MVEQCGGDVLCVRGRVCLAFDPLRDFGAAAVVCHGGVPVLTAAQGVQLGVKAAVVFGPVRFVVPAYAPRGSVMVPVYYCGSQ